MDKQLQESGCRVPASAPRPIVMARSHARTQDEDLSVLRERGQVLEVFLKTACPLNVPVACQNVTCFCGCYIRHLVSFSKMWPAAAWSTLVVL